jgi:hypothetical protein
VKQKTPEPPQHLVFQELERQVREKTALCEELAEIVTVQLRDSRLEHFKERLAPASVQQFVRNIEQRLAAGDAAAANALVDGLRSLIDSASAVLNVPNQIMGAQRREQQRSASALAHEKKAEKAAEQHREYHELAAEIRKRNPKISLRECARRICDELGLPESKQSRIERIITPAK